MKGSDVDVGGIDAVLQPFDSWAEVTFIPDGALAARLEHTTDGGEVPDHDSQSFRLNKKDQELDFLVKPSKEGATIVKQLRVSGNWKARTGAAPQLESNVPKLHFLRLRRPARNPPRCKGTRKHADVLAVYSDVLLEVFERRPETENTVS